MRLGTQTNLRQRVRHAAPVVLALVLGSCSIDRQHTAERAEAKLVGMSRADLYRCAGLPHRETVLDGVTFATYDNQISTSNALSLPFIGGGLTQGSNNYCRTTFTLEKGAVSSVTYAGDTGPFYAAHEQCSYTVQACMKMIEDREKAAGPILLPEPLRPSYSEMSRPGLYDQP